MARRDREADESGEVESTYGLAPPDKQKEPRYRPMRGFRASSNIGKEGPPPSPLARLIGDDPFPWLICLSVIVWVALGIAGKYSMIFAIALGAMGLFVCFLAQVYLYLSIWESDRGSLLWCLLSDWYRLFYLYSNPEVAWRPTLVAIVGLFMVFTSGALIMMHR